MGAMDGQRVLTGFDRIPCLIAAISPEKGASNSTALTGRTPRPRSRFWGIFRIRCRAGRTIWSRSRTGAVGRIGTQVANGRRLRSPRSRMTGTETQGDVLVALTRTDRDGGAAIQILVLILRAGRGQVGREVLAIHRRTAVIGGSPLLGGWVLWKGEGGKRPTNTCHRLDLGCRRSERVGTARSRPTGRARLFETSTCYGFKFRSYSERSGLRFEPPALRESWLSCHRWKRDIRGRFPVGPCWSLGHCSCGSRRTAPWVKRRVRYEDCSLRWRSRCRCRRGCLR
jgi:hypothetical protein